MKQKGFILPFVIFILSLMALLVYGIMQLVLINQANSSRYKDMQLVQNLAKQAIFANGGAVERIKAFEGLQWTTESGTNRFDEIYDMVKRSEISTTEFTDNCGFGSNNKGFCSFASMSNNYSDPWLRISTSSSNPCNGSYKLHTVSSIDAALPILDDAKSSWSILYQTGYSNLCTQPRYIIELLDYDFTLTSVVSSARLYRVTSKAFGVNGTTTSTYQAYFYVRCGSGSDCYPTLLSGNILE